jgi:hypothetical protein
MQCKYECVSACEDTPSPSPLAAAAAMHGRTACNGRIGRFAVAPSACTIDNVTIITSADRDTILRGDVGGQERRRGEEEAQWCE